MQGVVILREPQQRMAGVAGEEFRDDAQAIEIGCKAGADDGGLFSAIKRCGVGEKPSGKEMSDRAHCPENGVPAEYLRRKSLPLITQIKTDFHLIAQCSLFWPMLA
jgi:hypothetical protein